MPMLVVRHERTLAMDGDYIHVRFIASVSYSYPDPYLP